MQFKNKPYRGKSRKWARRRNKAFVRERDARHGLVGIWAIPQPNLLDIGYWCTPKRSPKTP